MSFVMEDVTIQAVEVKDGRLRKGDRFWAVEHGVVTAGVAESFPRLNWAMHAPRGVLSGDAVHPPKSCYLSELSAREHAVCVLRHALASTTRAAEADREALQAAVLELEALKKRSPG